MQIILSVSIAVLAGLLMTRVVKSLKLPDVTAYLTAGIFVGPYFLGSLGIDGLGFISMEAVDLMTLVSQVALGFIAFAIGNEFRLEEITHIGRQAFRGAGHHAWRHFHRNRAGCHIDGRASI